MLNGSNLLNMQLLLTRKPVAYKVYLITNWILFGSNLGVNVFPSSSEKKEETNRFRHPWDRPDVDFSPRQQHLI